ncbi:hypothetical protein A9G33_00255 [Gilliamella sp. Choc3-5]|uniref:hypothetical protein n=1 Tax=Gilliamella sp. Choc3-5 TaxID=3120236 RepID=UPI00080EA59F|nr:hypothetical protein [Gilliamella apicola]OCG31506.1 hypothetical protein A9G33_00255 [Gilliamella apicola]
MAKCLNCNNEIRMGRLKNDCPYCNYPQPTWSNKSLIVSWSFFCCTFLLCGFLLSKVFLVILLIQMFFFSSMLRERKYFSCKAKQKEPIEQKDTTSSDTINFGTEKLSKSSPEKILKSKVKKAIKADAKKEKNRIQSEVFLTHLQQRKKKKRKKLKNVIDI